MRIICTLVLSVIFFTADAQDVLELDPLSIISSRSPQKVSETGRSITVIDGKLIQHLPVYSLDDLLKYTSSVEIQQRGPAGSQADIIIRGGTFQQVLVLLDGIKINDPITGHFSAYMPIPMTQIERIEILKGPAAAIYGSEAVGGVINIISKTFAGFVKEKKLSTKAGIAAGEYGFLAAHADFRKTGEKVNFSIAGQSTEAKGQPLRGNEKGYFKNQMLSANAGFILNENWKLLLHSSYDSRDFAAQNFYTTFVSDTATEKVNTWWNHAKLKYSKEKSTDEIDIAYKHTTDNFLFNPRSIANNNKSGSISLQYVHAQNVSANLKYNFGMLGEQKLIRSNDRGNHSNNHIAGFGSLSYTINKWSLNPGLRLVHDENYGTQILPQANLAYRLKNVVLKANAGRAIRSADFTERYNNYNKKIVTGGSIGNPDLTTEKSWSYEAGADLLLPYLKFSAVGFYRDQDNVIDFVRTPYANMPRKDNLVAAGTYALAKNIKKVNTSGLELEANYRRSFKKDQQLYINLSATFMNSNSSDSVPSFYIISHAKTLLQQSIIYSYKKINIAVTSIYKVRNEQQSPAIKAFITRNYWLVNAKVDYRYKIATAFIAVNNIGNIQYSDLLGSKMPGSWTTAGLSISL